MSSSPSLPTSISDSRGLSPLKLSRERSISRPSSRNSNRSLRAHSPSFSLDDPVSLRNQVSTLKHNIRQQQAQVQNLENIIRTSHTIYDFSEEMSSSPPSSYTPNASTSTKMKRRSSYDILYGIAGPDSNLPLPKRDNLEENGIPEGVPVSPPYKRPVSPTRTLSRIPVAAVGNARALADDGQPPPKLSPSPSNASKTSLVDPDTSQSSLLPPSPNRRLSFTPNGTSKVLADLHAGVTNARNALENTKAQLRLSQRTVAQLTRQTEDLKEGRERLRLENEGLNNVVARKERLLQEVLERARKAEAEVAALKAQLKTETTTNKKTMQEMKSALSESTALSQKSEREYITLRDSIKGLVESWKDDTHRLKEEMRKREEKFRGEAESIGKKYRTLLEEIKSTERGTEEIKRLHEDDLKATKDVENAWQAEIGRLREQVEQSSKGTEEAVNTARGLAEELARLRRLMQAAGRSPSITTTFSTDSEAPP